MVRVRVQESAPKSTASFVLNVVFVQRQKASHHSAEEINKYTDEDKWRQCRMSKVTWKMTRVLAKRFCCAGDDEFISYSRCRR